LAKGAKETTWLKTLSIELGFSNDEPTQIWCDNISALKIAKDSIFDARTKHIEIWCNNISALKIAKDSIFHARTKHIETHYHYFK
jgi:hypothetical protein